MCFPEVRPLTALCAAPPSSVLRCRLGSPGGQPRQGLLRGPRQPHHHLAAAEPGRQVQPRDPALGVHAADGAAQQEVGQPAERDRNTCACALGEDPVESDALSLQVPEHPEDHGHGGGRRQPQAGEEQQRRDRFGPSSRRYPEPLPEKMASFLRLAASLSLIGCYWLCVCSRPRLPGQSAEDQPSPPVAGCQVHHAPRVLHRAAQQLRECDTNTHTSAVQLLD